jgi:hypothetical protein
MHGDLWQFLVSAIVVVDGAETNANLMKKTEKGSVNSIVSSGF